MLAPTELELASEWQWGLLALPSRYTSFLAFLRSLCVLSMTAHNHSAKLGKFDNLSTELGKFEHA